MSELDPVTFLIATELLAGSTSNISQRRTAVLQHAANPTALILLSNSNPEGDWSVPFEDLCLRAQRDFGANAVRIAYLQSECSSLAEVVEDLLSRRIHQIRILPLFLSPDPLVGDDIAERIHELEHKYAALEIELLPAIGQDARLQRLLWQVVRENILPEWLAKTS
jgi:sirohydrochlorin ferrochelatase